MYIYRCIYIYITTSFDAISQRMIFSFKTVCRWAAPWVSCWSRRSQSDLLGTRAKPGADASIYIYIYISGWLVCASTYILYKPMRCIKSRIRVVIQTSIYIYICRKYVSISMYRYLSSLYDIPWTFCTVALSFDASVGQDELTAECNYETEAESTRTFQGLITSSAERMPVFHDFIVPSVISALSTQRILTTTWVSGIPLDKITSLSQVLRSNQAWNLLTRPSWLNVMMMMMSSLSERMTFDMFMISIQKKSFTRTSDTECFQAHGHGSRFIHLKWVPFIGSDICMMLVAAHHGVLWRWSRASF